MKNALRIRIRTSYVTEPVNCPSGCWINVGSSSLTTDSKYLLVQGSMNVEYIGEAAGSIDSPYTESGKWMNYVDSWQYNKDVKLHTNTNTFFVQITAKDQANNPAQIDLSVYNLENDSVTKFANANSAFCVVGDSFILDGESYNKQTTIQIRQERDIVVSTDGSCKIMYFEEA